MRPAPTRRNTVTKYTAAEHATQLIHGPKSSTARVDPFRDYSAHYRPPRRTRHE